MNFVFWLQSMPDLKYLGPHLIKTVIDDENLDKLSFFKTCFTNLTPLFMVTMFFNVSDKRTGAHHPPVVLSPCVSKFCKCYYNYDYFCSGLKGMAIFETF